MMEEERRHNPFNNTPYQCMHEKTMSKLENETGHLEESVDALKENFQQLLVKLDVFTSQMPIIHHKQDEYAKGYALIIHRLDQIENKIADRVNSLEKETENSFKAIEEKLLLKIENGQVRVHERIDLIKIGHDELKDNFKKAFWIGSGMWTILVLWYLLYQPVGEIKKVTESISIIKNQVDDLMSWKIGQDQKTIIERRK
jgi:predicted component of type VI protein secretion system